MVNYRLKETDNIWVIFAKSCVEGDGERERERTREDEVGNR